MNPTPQMSRNVSNGALKSGQNVNIYVNKNVDMSTFCQQKSEVRPMIAQLSKFQCSTPIIEEDTSILPLCDKTAISSSL